MSNHFFGTAIIAGVMALAAMNLGCDKSLSGPTPPTSPTSPALGALTVTAVSPTTGAANFASQINVAGTGFLSGATLTLDGLAATVTSMNSTRIWATTPVHAAGTVDVVVTNPGGQRAALTGSYTFEVVAISLSASPSLVTSGDQLTVSWSAARGWSALDWIGLFKVGVPSTSYQNGWWDYAHGGASGTLTLSAPAQPGEYEFRYMLDDGFIDVARSPVRVSAAASP
ncbi:MAG: IPT/TIG domain-containing protein [Acidobacteriota bacterium]